jgi:glycosyltransferase involved in cell wall biosynthesis
VRVTIDCSPLLMASAGVKTYLYHLSKELLAIAGSDSIRLFPFLRSLGDLDHGRSSEGRIATFARLIYMHHANQIGPLNGWLAPKTDLFHCTNQILNPPRRGRLTSTVHDMTCWLLPETHRPATIERDKLFANRVLSRSDRLVAVSECSRRDAIEILGLEPDRVEVIYSGVTANYFEAASARTDAVRLSYGLDKPYLIFVGTIEPRKNVDALIDAFVAAGDAIRKEFDLVIVGPHGWKSKDTAVRLESGIPSVRYLGYVPENDLPLLTSAAEVLAYPSLYEGFGFPVAQAMAAGTAVLTSNVSSLPEVAGEAALLIDPRSVDSIRDGLIHLLHSPSLREELARKGRERANLFTWRRAAEQTWRFFERACEMPSGTIAPTGPGPGGKAAGSSS